jgi:hypothetical protein
MPAMKDGRIVAPDRPALTFDQAALSKYGVA